jgi:hypothetical protein
MYLCYAPLAHSAQSISDVFICFCSSVYMSVTAKSYARL